MNCNRTLLSFALGLGLSILGTSSLQAQHRTWNRNCCPPTYVPACPDTTHPGDLPSPEGDSAMTPSPDSDTPSTTPTPSDQQAMQPQFGDMAQPSLALASGGQGAQTAMLGRLDMNNRFNLFDNMSAIPRSRAWFGYQLADGHDSGVRFTETAKAIFQQGWSVSGASAGGSPIVHGVNLNGYSLQQVSELIEGATGDIVNRGAQNGYRFGVEWAVNCDFSVAIQGNYVMPYDTDDPAEDWTSPEIMFKQVLSRSDNSVVSAVFGYAPEVGKDGILLTEDNARVYPGMLAYHQLTDDHFIQGGFQFGIPLQGDLYTFDWAVGMGYWLYRHESLNGCCDSCCNCNQPWILGIIPQFEVLGKHVIGDTTVRGPFGLSPTPPTTDFGELLEFGPYTLNEAIFIFEEPRHVVDLTIGANILMHHNMTLGTGISFPITEDTVRRAEFLAQLTYGF